MRKIHPSVENPIDNIILDLVNETDGIYKKLNFSPNHLTTISFLFGILTAYYIYNGNNKLACVTLFLSYYYDCMDGHFARKYNMVTEFGDYYDHLSDWLKTIVILIALYKRNPDKFKIAFPILTIFCLLVALHTGCQEKVSSFDGTQPLLDNFKLLCPNNDFIYYSRWFGSGTLFMVMIIIIFMYEID